MTARRDDEADSAHKGVEGDPPSAVQVAAIRAGRKAVCEPPSPLPETYAEAIVELTRLHHLAPERRQRKLASKSSRGTGSLEQRIRERERRIVQSFHDADEPRTT